MNDSDQTASNDNFIDFDTADVGMMDPTALSLGKRWVKQLQDMLRIRSLLTEIGWTAVPSHSGPSSIPDTVAARREETQN